MSKAQLQALTSSYISIQPEQGASLYTKERKSRKSELISHLRGSRMLEDKALQFWDSSPKKEHRFPVLK